MQKNALVLAGGGSRGAYQIGVWEALRELGINIDIVTGTSVGALNGAAIVQDEFELTLDMWSRIENNMVLDFEIPEGKNGDISVYAREFFKNGGAEYTSLKKLLTHYIDEHKVRKSPVDYGIVTVELNGFKPHNIFKENIADGKLIDYMLASAACFPAFKPYVIEGLNYIDGGYYDNLPINMALDRGADSIVAVDLNAFGLRRSVKNKLKKSTDIKYIYARWDLGNFLFFDKEFAKRNLRLGYLDGMKAFSFFDGRAYAFMRGGFADFVNERKNAIHTYSNVMGTSFLCEHEQNNNGNFKSKGFVEGLNNAVIEKTLFEAWGAKMDGVSKITACAEACGKIFDISPLQVYTIASFVEEIMQKAKIELADSGARALYQNVKNINAGDLLVNFGSLNAKVITLCIANAMLKNAGKAESSFKNLPAVLPKEFAAAFFLVVSGVSSWLEGVVG